MGGGSGGGSSTSVTYMYPEWVRGFYERANDAVWADAYAAKSSNPYRSAPPSPSETTANLSALGRWVDTQLYAYDPKDLFDILLKGPDNIPDSIFSLLKRAEIVDAIKGQAASIMRVVEEDSLPKYRRGMQTIGAVNTSAFKIGEALLWKGQLESLNDKYYDRLVVPAFQQTLQTIENMQNLYINKLAQVLQYAELRMKIEAAIYEANNSFAMATNEFNAAQLRWPLEVDSMLVSAAGSWQSTPQSSETKTKQSAGASTWIGGLLGAGSIAASLFG